LAALQVEVVVGQPTEELAPVHAAVGGRLVYRSFHLDRDRYRHAYRAPDLAGVMFRQLFSHKTFRSYSLIFTGEMKKRKTKSISVTVPIGWKERIDRQAASEGRTRSGHITWLVRRYLTIVSLNL
jgi:hypothetical protein